MYWGRNTATKNLVKIMKTALADIVRETNYKRKRKTFLKRKERKRKETIQRVAINFDF